MSNPRGNHSSFSPYHSNLTNQLFYPSLPSGFSPQAGSSSSHAPVSASSLCTRHRYTLRSTKENARPWLSLILTSRSPRPEFLPLFVGKDVVSGVVELDLSKPDTIREVKIMVCPSPSFLPTWQHANGLEAQGRDYPPCPRIEHFYRAVTDISDAIGKTVRANILSVQFRPSRRSYYSRV